MKPAVGLAAGLVIIWVLAWGSLSWANVLAGMAVSAAVLAGVPDLRRATHLPIVRPVATLRLGARVVRDLSAATGQLARRALTPGARLTPGVVRVPLAGCSDALVTIIANLVAMTPGTLPVEVEQHPTVMYVHVLHLRDPDQVRRAIWSLRDQVVAAFGTREALAAVARARSDGTGSEGA
jgi:multicomponent Na+:H+ antiporter subunit E